MSSVSTSNQFVGALTLLWPTSPLNVAVASWGSTLAFFLFFDLAEAMQQRLSEYTRFKEEVFSLSLRGLVSTHETGVSCSAKASFS